MDADYRPVPEAASFLEHLRLGRDAAEGTCRMYAGALALYLEWCHGTDRDLVRGAAELGRFVQYLRTTAISRPGRGQGRPRGAGRITQRDRSSPSNHLRTAGSTVPSVAGRSSDSVMDVRADMQRVTPSCGDTGCRRHAGTDALRHFLLVAPAR